MATNNHSFTKNQPNSNKTSTRVNHSNANKRRSLHVPRKVVYCTSIGATMTEASLEVYTSGFKEVFIVPRRDILHMPDPEVLKIVARLILCVNFRAQDPEHSCHMGKRCRFVHADLAHALNHNVHINYAWRSVDQVAYERFDAQLGELEVAPPNGKLPDMLIPANCILKTNAIRDPRRPLSHCAHYYYSRACNRGPECSFIHAVYVDADARDHQRAPAPSRDKHGLTAQYPAILRNDHRLSPSQAEGSPNNSGSEERSRSMISPLSAESHSLGVSSNDEFYDDGPPTGLSLISVTEDTTPNEEVTDKRQQKTKPQCYHRSQQQGEGHFHSSFSKDGAGLCCCPQQLFMNATNTSDGANVGKASSVALRSNRSPVLLPRPRNHNNNKRSLDGEQPTVHAQRQSTNRFSSEKPAAAIEQHEEETQQASDITAPRFRYNPYSFSRACVVV